MLSWFVLAMVLYPQVQQKAQREIDEIIGRGRLPIFADRQRLPYINAIYNECLRWHPVIELCTYNRLFMRRFL